MAQVNKNSDLIHDPYQPGAYPADPQRARGRPIVATGTVINAAEDSAGSKYRLASIPSTALIHEDTFFGVANWGFGRIKIGTETDTDALVDQTKSTENIVQPVDIGDASHGKYLWEILGLAKDPGAHIELWAHADAAATAEGSMQFRISYLHT